jgi:hypothetical protein
VAFTLLIESIPNMRPDLRKLLETQGVAQPDFSREIDGYVYRMFAKDGHTGRKMP